LVHRSTDDPEDRGYYQAYGPEVTRIEELVRVCQERWAVEESWRFAGAAIAPRGISQAWHLLGIQTRSRGDKDPQHIVKPQVNEQILALRILVGEHLDRALTGGDHEVRVKLLRSEADYAAVGEHHGDVYN
jgi:hypothetical protein